MNFKKSCQRCVLSIQKLKKKKNPPFSELLGSVSSFGGASGEHTAISGFSVGEIFSGVCAVYIYPI